MDSRDASIVVVSWNTRDLLAACLESVREKAPGAELIVVDNASADGSAAMVKAKFPEALLVENPGNWGFARAVNQGLDRMTRRVAILLNPDATLADGAVEALLKSIEDDPTIGIAGAQLLDADGRRQHSFDNAPTLLSESLNKSILRMLLPGKYPSKATACAEITDVDTVIGACMALRRELLAVVGPLDEDYFVFLEETDWCLRFRRAGYRVVHVPQARVFHLQGKSKNTRPVLARIEYLRSLFLFFRKNRGPLSHLLLRGVRLLKSLVNTVFSFVFAALTLFLAPSLRRRLAIHAGLLGWQLLGGPASIGLRPAGLPPPRPRPAKRASGQKVAAHS